VSTRGSGRSEVPAPTQEVWDEVIDNLLQTEPRVRQVRIPDFHLELVECFWRDARSLPSFEMPEPEELALFRARHALFRLVDLQPGAAGQVRLTEVITRSPARRLRT